MLYKERTTGQFSFLTTEESFLHSTVSIKNVFLYLSYTYPPQYLFSWYRFNMLARFGRLELNISMAICSQVWVNWAICPLIPWACPHQRYLTQSSVPAAGNYVRVDFIFWFLWSVGFRTVVPWGCRGRHQGFRVLRQLLCLFQRI